MIILPRKKIYKISCDKQMISYKFKSKTKRDEEFLKFFNKNKKYKTEDLVEIKENNFDNFINYVEDLQKKCTNLQKNNLTNFIEYQQNIGQVLRQVEKLGITCENCKYCKTVLSNGKEQKCCIRYQQLYNLPIEKIKNLCEFLEIEDNAKV